MKKILVTGGTVFVSKFVAQYFSERGNEVYVLNRNSRKQPENTILIEADRNNLKDTLKKYDFDVVLDVTAYTGKDVENLLNALGNFKEYILISSSAVYPETGEQPFKENAILGANKFWGAYGTDKMDAEKNLKKRVPSAYILRPPYLYGPMNNVYREAFVFECALKERKFYIPKDGGMQLQFFHVRDLCRMMEEILEKKPAQHIFNVGNEESVSVLKWVEMCYRICGKELDIEEIWNDVEQRKYFSFYNYEYMLDVSEQKKILSKLTPLEEGLREAYEWYRKNEEQVVKKNYLTFIDENLATNSCINEKH